MQSLFWEHLKSAMRNFSVVLWIILRAITFCLVRQNYLHMSFRSKGATLKQRSLSNYTSSVNIPPSMDVIQGVSDHSKSFEELICEYVTSAFVDLIQSGYDVVLKFLVHVYGSGCGGGRLGLSEVLFPEQELAVEVAYLDHVGVRQHHAAARHFLRLVGLPHANAQHCVVLKQLAPNGSCTYHEQTGVRQFVNHIASEYDAQSIGPVAHLVRLNDVSHVFFLEEGFVALEMVCRVEFR